MATNPGFQVSLDVKGRVCVVIGGDDEAADKVQRLLDAGAKVDDRQSHLKRRAAPTDVIREDRAQSQKLSSAGRRRGHACDEYAEGRS